jgi:hypothetical protein
VLGGCWLLSFVLPVVDAATPNGTDIWYGWMILMTGWIGVFAGQFGWLANAVLPGGLLMMVLPNRGPILRALLIMFALLLLALTVNATAWHEIPTDYASNQVARFRIGYYLWMGAMVGGAVTGLVSAFWRAPAPSEESPPA